MSNKVKCLFGKHDLYRDDKDYRYKCNDCPIVFSVHDGENTLNDFVIENGESIHLTPYLYTTEYELVLSSSIELTEDEVLSLYHMTEIKEKVQ